LRDFIATIDLPALVTKYAGEGKHVAGKWLFTCPNPHHPDGKPSFSVFQGRDNLWRCGCLSACGHIGDALDFVQWVEHCDKSHGVAALRAFTGDHFTPTPQPKKAKKATPVPVPAGTEYEPAHDDAALAAYLQARQWPTEVVEAFGLQVVRDDRGTVRVLHPFVTYEGGQWVPTTWQARRVDSSRFIPWRTQRGATMPLYNVRALDSPHLRAVVVCEGPADTVTAWLALRGLDFVGAVGVAGAQAWKPDFAAYFEGLAVVIAGDNDPAGEAFTYKVARDLQGVAGQLIAACPPHGVKDLGELHKAHGLEEVRRLLTSALPFTVAPLEVTGDESTEEGRELAAVLRIFAGSFTVCQVCAKPSHGLAYCTACATAARVGGRSKDKPAKWVACDSCGEYALDRHRRKCSRAQCGGTFVVCEVQP
jgi:hypothetical protein